MNSEAAMPVDSTSRTESIILKSKRLHYLDWLRVILLFGVFLYHVLKPFDPSIAWHINNADKTDAVMGILMSINPWGIPLFFLVSGAGSWFALRRRSNRQYITVGNLAENDRMFLLLMNYAERTRLKVWGRGRVADDDPALLEQVRDPDYPARPERVIRMHVQAWDTNCNSHIPHLISEDTGAA